MSRIRIPTDQLNPAVQQLSKLGKVRNLSRSAEDITRAVVLEDSQAGMTAGRAAGFQVLQVQHPSDIPKVLSAAGI